MKQPLLYLVYPLQIVSQALSMLLSPATRSASKRFTAFIDAVEQVAMRS